MLPGTYLSSGAGYPLIYSAVYPICFLQNLSEMQTISADGAFKIRSAANTILGRLQKMKRIRRNGVVTASTGNHGRAVSYVAEKLGIPATVYLSSLVPENKVRNIELEGSQVVRVGASGMIDGRS